MEPLGFSGAGIRWVTTAESPVTMILPGAAIEPVTNRHVRDGWAPVGRSGSIDDADRNKEKAVSAFCR